MNLDKVKGRKANTRISPVSPLGTTSSQCLLAVSQYWRSPRMLAKSILQVVMIDLRIVVLRDCSQCLCTVCWDNIKATESYN